MFIYPTTGTYPSSWTTHKAKRRSLESSMQYDFKMVYTWQPPEISDKGFQSFLSYYIRGENMENPSRIKIWAQLSPQTLMIPKLERFPGMIPPKPFYARIWMCIYIYMWYCVIIYAIKIILHGYSIGQWTRETFPSSVGRNRSLTVRWLDVQHIVTHQILHLRRADDQQKTEPSGSTWEKNEGIPTTSHNNFKRECRENLLRSGGALFSEKPRLVT